MTKREILEAFATEIQKHEGFHPRNLLRGYWGSRSWRNNNPGNLKTGKALLYKGQTGWDYGGFARFGNYQAGWEALLYDITAKFEGRSRTGLNPQSTILDFFKRYAPAGDSNNPLRYAQAVCAGLKAKGLIVHEATYLGDLLAMAVEPKRELKILAVQHNIPVEKQATITGLVGSACTYLRNAFEGQVGVSLRELQLPNTLQIDTLTSYEHGQEFSVSLRELQLPNTLQIDTLTSYEHGQEFKEINIYQLNNLIKDHIGQNEIVLFLFGGQGRTRAYLEPLNGVAFNTVLVIPTGEDLVLLEAILHELTHCIHILARKRSNETVEDTTHSHPALNDPRKEANLAYSIKLLEKHWGLL